MLQSETVKKYDTYKDSGIEWIGEIPQEWTVGNLKRLTDFIKNGTSATQVENETEYKVSRIETISTGEINYSKTGYVQYFDNIDDYRLNSNDILFSNINSLEMVGNVAIYDNKQPLYSGMNLLRISINKSTSPKWLFYVLRNSYFVEQVKANAKHAINQVSISVGRLSQIPIIIPSKGEQQRIAEYLDKKCGEIDRVVETEKSVIEKLKEYKQSIITEAVTKGLDKSVPLKDSGIEWIGKIPQHWHCINWGLLISILTDYTANGSFADLASNVVYLDEIDYARLIRLTDLRTNLKEKGVYVNEHAYNYLSKSALYGGELLLANVGANAGYVCEMPFVDYKTTLAPNMMLIKFDKNKCNNHFMYLMSQCKYIQQQLQLAANKTTAQPKLNKDDVRAIYCLMPPWEEQQQIAEYLDNKCSEIDKAIADKEQVIEKFTEYKKSLIYECVTGKRKVAI